MIAHFSYRSVARVFGAVSLVLGALMLGVTLESARVLGVDIVRSNWLFLILIQLGAAAVAVLAFGATFHPGWERAERWLTQSAPSGMPVRWAGAVLLAVSFASIFVARQFFSSYLVSLVYPTMWIVWWACLPGALGLRLFAGRGWALSFGGVLLAAGVLLKVIALTTAISAYPLSLGWSESSRFYYASLYFAGKLYGGDVPLSVMHPTRYFLQSLPFLLDGLPLWVHRAWQVILWVLLSAAASAALVRRLALSDRFVAWATAGWFFLYLFQGAVYYHLLVMIIVVMLGVSARHPWRSLVVVLLASIWAGVSRLNWFPVPGMLAAALYFLEQPVNAQRGWLRYLAAPAGWFAGGLVMALGAQSAYIFLSGNANNLEAFGSSFTSDLLWYRLLPSPTFPLGTLPGILIVSVPLAAVMLVFMRHDASRWHPIRLAGLAAVLLVLFGGGLVVSVKIGGGGDLHNMDAFMAVAGVVGASIFFQRGVADRLGESAAVSWLSAALGVLIPVYFCLQGFGMSYRPNDPYGDFVVVELRTRLESAAAGGEESLLITQRHLVSMGLVDIPLVPEYEVVTLMEMAMSRNERYLGQFYRDLDAHRFAYIVVSPLFLGYKGAQEPFGEENDMWVRYVARPLACEYEPLETFDDAQVQVLVPRTSNPVCPGQP